MKTIVHTSIILLIAALMTSCGPEKQIHLKERTITVTGVAETEVTPDEFFLTIKLEEYYKEDYRYYYYDYYYHPKNKVKLEKIEPLLLKTLDSLGIKKEQITLTDIGNSWRWWGKEILVSKDISIKTSDIATAAKIVSSLNLKGVANVSLSNSNYSKIKEIRRELRINAIKAAKEKAEYMLESIGKKPGDIIAIEEIGGNDAAQTVYPYLYKNCEITTAQASRGTGNVSLDESSAGYNNNQASLGAKKISLNYSVRAEFEIK